MHSWPNNMKVVVIESAWWIHYKEVFQISLLLLFEQHFIFHFVNFCFPFSKTFMHSVHSVWFLFWLMHAALFCRECKSWIKMPIRQTWCCHAFVRVWTLHTRFKAAPHWCNQWGTESMQERQNGSRELFNIRFQCGSCIQGTSNSEPTSFSVARHYE